MMSHPFVFCRYEGMMNDFDFTHLYEPAYWAKVGILALRMLVALALGAIVGLERESAGKGAGIRTHMLVTLTAALLMIIPSALTMSSSDISRIIQGMLAGMGFIGAGVIIKVEAEQQVIGLTTAAGLWLSTAVGVAAGLGCYAIAVLTTVLAVLTLRLFFQAEKHKSKNS
jgi:putative Mg2+ transporter-C (MgtC) family protein